jgi:hypothetical protein
MIDDHWFDALNKRLARSSQRRGLLRVAAALSIAQHLGASHTVGKGGGKGGKRKGNGKGGGGKHEHKGNGKGNGNKKPKPPKPPDDSDIPAICNRTWPFEEQAANREWCKFIWEQCPPGGDEQFCIVRNGGPYSTPITDCCNTGEACCNETCRDIWSDSLNCGGCDRQCLHYETCIAGRCMCDIDLYDECPDGCVNTLRDPHNCGSCGNECPYWTVCINGECKCAPDRKECAMDHLPLPACIRPTDICCPPTVCSGGVCCIDPNGAGHCLSEDCPDGWETRRA